MTDHIYKDEAIIRSVTYSTRGGHKVSFEMDPEGWERLKGMETTRCAMVLVPIDNEGAPAPATQAPEKPRRRMSELSRAQQAGILCNDQAFQDWAATKKNWESAVGDKPSDAAAKYVRLWCGVESRSQIDEKPNSRQAFDHLRSEFDAHMGRTARPYDR